MDRISITSIFNWKCLKNWSYTQSSIWQKLWSLQFAHQITPLRSWNWLSGFSQSLNTIPVADTRSLCVTRCHLAPTLPMPSSSSSTLSSPWCHLFCPSLLHHRLLCLLPLYWCPGGLRRWQIGSAIAPQNTALPQSALAKRGGDGVVASVALVTDPRSQSHVLIHYRGPNPMSWFVNEVRISCSDLSLRSQYHVLICHRGNNIKSRFVIEISISHHDFSSRPQCEVMFLLLRSQYHVMICYWSPNITSSFVTEVSNSCFDLWLTPQYHMLIVVKALMSCFNVFCV
jgi:hypothetical protein